ncbi:biopolymer transporter ExbD [Fontimonas sp. SYSU GA230001]|uniref:ExbD/TolR family protein n=1 Tax=Fontimonas sp. SYSU GA230001 TaxID=3142450 RepID=UPI0032B53E5A
MTARWHWRHAVQAVVLVVALAWLGWRMREPAPIELRIVDAGQVVVEGRRLAVGEVGSHVAALRAGDARRPVRLVVDARAPSTVLIPVLDALQRSGIDDVQVIANP